MYTRKEAGPNPPSDRKMKGYQLTIAGDVLRARYRKSLEKPEPIVSGAVTQYAIGFPGNDHVFRAGNYRVALRLKKRDKMVVSAVVTIEIRPGIRDL